MRYIGCVCVSGFEKNHLFALHISVVFFICSQWAVFTSVQPHSSAVFNSPLYLPMLTAFMANKLKTD